MIKAKPWKGKDLKGVWIVTRKLDGARMLRDDEGNPVSRSGKPLYNLGHIHAKITDAEIFLTDWETSMGLVRSSVNGSPVPESCVYSLDPLDDRLYLTTAVDPTAQSIQRLLKQQLDKGDEGLILRQGDTWLKVKPKGSADVYVTGFQNGTGKHSGRMGALLTNRGKVGTGFTDEQRGWWQMMFDLHGLQWLTKQLIEVEYMELTDGGKFRHPRYLRLRDDKTEETPIEDM
jgi:ATP-dependent DNA ligase